MKSGVIEKEYYYYSVYQRKGSGGVLLLFKLSEDRVEPEVVEGDVLLLLKCV